MHLETSAPELSKKVPFFEEFGVKNNKFQIPPNFCKKGIYL